MHRMTRVLIGLAFVLGFTGTARAGGPGLDPFHSAVEICGNNGEVATDSMVSSTGVFGDLADCKSLCGKAEGICKKLQKRTAGCYLDHFKSQELWSKRACKVTYSLPAEIKQCERGVKEAYAEDFAAFADETKARLQTCHSWGDECRDTCETL